MEKRFNDLLTSYQASLAKNQKQSQVYVIIRSMLLLVFIAVLVLALQYQSVQPYFLYFFIGWLVIFMIICFYHDKVNKQITTNQEKIVYTTNYIKRIHLDYQDFKETGQEFEGDDYLYDLDIIGDHSLYQYLCVAKSKGGQRKLFEKLSNHSMTKEKMKQSQDALIDLNKNIEFCITLEQLLSHLSSALYKQLELLKKPTKSHKLSLFLFSGLSVICLILGLLCLMNVLPAALFVMAALINLSFSWLYHFVYGDDFNRINEGCKHLSYLSEIYKCISKTDFKSSLLNDIKAKSQAGLKSLKKINRMESFNSINQNFLGYIIANSLLPINSYLLYLYKDLQDDSLDDFYTSISALEELEALMSLAVIGVCQDNVCCPELDDHVRLSFTDIRHPLIKNCVTNSFECQNNIVIITGSNMSGKTTFMRTIGINLILRDAGGLVCATSFSSPYMEIVTSMRVKDDIDKGISTFYEELLRIKKLIDKANSDKLCIGFIDEIFKGTNYNDRLFGVQSIIKQLTKDNVIAFITTHDFELCKSDNKQLVNYYFEEYYVNDTIHFDYKIKEGKCPTTNARYLMSRLGLL